MMNDRADNTPTGTDPDVEAKGATQQRDPERELELKLKKNPGDKQAQVDVGSDQSMDASDPHSATQPGGNEPVPSSGFPKRLHRSGKTWRKRHSGNPMTVP